MAEAVNSNNPCAVRYPKGSEILYDAPFVRSGDISVADVGEGEKAVAVITYGRPTHNVYFAAKALEKDIKTRVIKLHKIKPLSADEIFSLCADHEKVLVVEEGIERGGVGEQLAAYFGKKQKEITVKAVDTEKRFSGNVTELYEEFGFSIEKLCETLNNI